jgi:hypothetical protein
MKRLHRFIKALEAELHTLLMRLSEEAEQLEICNSAIFNLELAIAEGRRLIKANEDNLSSFIAIRSRSDIKPIEPTKMKDEPTTKSLYNELQGYSKNLAICTEDLIDAQIDAIRKDVRILSDKVYQLEIELSGWMSSENLSESVIKRLIDSRTAIRADLKAGRQAFRSIWKIPPELWAKIFRYSIQGTKDIYIKTNDGYGMRPPMFNLSQVCQRWRYLVQSNVESWGLVCVAPHQVWRQDEYDLVIKSVQNSNIPITVVINLSQTFRYGYSSDNRYDQNGNCISCVSPNESTLFNGKEYTLLLTMSHDDSTTMQRLAYIPLRQASFLVLHGQGSFQYGYLFSYVSGFSNVKSLSIINDNPLSLPDITMTSYFPQLRQFSLQVRAFPQDFLLHGYLPTTLQELQLRNIDGGTLPILSSDIELPHLRVLEITSPGSYLLDRLTAKALKSLTLYGTRIYGESQFSFSDKASEIYNQLVHLKLEDWEPIPPPKTNKKRKKLPRTSERKTIVASQETPVPVQGSVILSKQILEKMPLLYTLTLSQSFIDGTALVTTFKTIMESSDQAKPGNLKEITLNHLTGITNEQCEELGKLVETVHIYM